MCNKYKVHINLILFQFFNLMRLIIAGVQETVRHKNHVLNS